MHRPMPPTPEVPEVPEMPEVSDTSEVPEGTPVGALARLRECRATLAGSTRQVGEFVLANPWEVRGLSIGDLAAHVGVSVNTVNRLTRELGYRGYREFMQALALDLGKILGSAYSVPVVGAPPLGQDGKPDLLGVIRHTLQVEQLSLQETMRQLDNAAVLRAVRALAGAQSVLLVGTGSGVPVCAAAAYRLTFLGIRAVACSDPATSIVELHLLRPGDVLFAISHHGAAQQVIYALQLARQRGLTTLCLTAAARSPAAQAADVTLVSCGYEASGVSGQFASRVVGAAMVEALVTAVAWHKYGGVPPHVEDLLRDQQEMHRPAPAGQPALPHQLGRRRPPGPPPAGLAGSGLAGRLCCAGVEMRDAVLAVERDLPDWVPPLTVGHGVLLPRLVERPATDRPPVRRSRLGSRLVPDASDVDVAIGDGEAVDVRGGGAQPLGEAHPRVELQEQPRQQIAV